jgi:hypothetical protein
MALGGADDLRRVMQPIVLMPMGASSMPHAAADRHRVRLCDILLACCRQHQVFRKQ